MREIGKLAFILFAISAVASFLLGFTNYITRDTIAEQIRLENEKARMEVLADAKEFEKVEQETILKIAKALKFENPEIITEVYIGKSGDTIVGYTIKSMPKGYAGEIGVLTGVSADGTLTGMRVTSNSETPGLGAKSTDPKFYGQFADKPIENPLEVIKSGTPGDNEIQAISGSTITSNAVTNGVNLSIQIYKELIK